MRPLRCLPRASNSRPHCTGLPPAMPPGRPPSTLADALFEPWVRPARVDVRGTARRHSSMSQDVIQMNALLQVRQLSVGYGKVEAVHGVSLDVRAGNIVTVIGPNGAGKTALLAAIIGVLPSRGDIDYDGASLTTL